MVAPSRLRCVRCARGNFRSVWGRRCRRGTPYVMRHVRAEMRLYLFAGVVLTGRLSPHLFLRTLLRVCGSRGVGEPADLLFLWGWEQIVIGLPLAAVFSLCFVCRIALHRVVPEVLRNQPYPEDMKRSACFVLARQLWPLSSWLVGHVVVATIAMLLPSTSSSARRRHHCY